MEQEGTISGTQALRLIRNTRLIPGATFGIRFITCDLNRAQYGQIRVYETCQLRTAPRKERVSVDPDHYIFFTDISADQSRQCFKKLIRAVCLPPSYKWLTVKWFL